MVADSCENGRRRLATNGRPGARIRAVSDHPLGSVPPPPSRHDRSASHPSVSVPNMNLVLALFLIANFYALGYATGRGRKCRNCGSSARSSA